ncbi:hypothetical protein LIER_34486 [Lithospermum erythrorhizon]|uniref:Uncharacterized protein n=1 Tax=Lithospermum erythrorhizon TaxID=34254 RepID=A0AAV3RZN4_LITER
MYVQLTQLLSQMGSPILKLFQGGANSASGLYLTLKLGRMLVDEGSAVNVIPLHILKLLNISTEDFQSTCIMIQADDPLVKAGSDPVKDAGMGKLPPEVIESKMHGLNEIQRMIQSKGKEKRQPKEDEVSNKEDVKKSLHPDTLQKKTQRKKGRVTPPKRRPIPTKRKGFPSNR